MKPLVAAAISFTSLFHLILLFCRLIYTRIFLISFQGNLCRIIVRTTLPWIADGFTVGSTAIAFATISVCRSFTIFGLQVCYPMWYIRPLSQYISVLHNHKRLLGPHTKYTFDSYQTLAGFQWGIELKKRNVNLDILMILHSFYKAPYRNLSILFRRLSSMVAHLGIFMKWC